jgi:excisionase family DNA binding protein
MSDLHVAPAPRLLTVRQASTYCACSISTLYRAARLGELRMFHLGRTTRFARAELDAWIDRAACGAARVLQEGSRQLGGRHHG